MKKILFLLLSTCAMYGQIVPTGQEQDFDYGIKNTASQLDDNAVFITVQNSDGVQGKSTSSVWAKKIYVDNADVKKAFLSTGLIKNGLVQANADPTKFNITAGIGVISNFDDPNNPTSTIVSFPAFTGITPTYLTSGNITYVAINSSAAVVMQASPFTYIQRRDLIILGAVIHSNLSTINTVNNISAPTNAGTNQLHDLMEAIGALNVSGNKYSANGANLSLNKSAGDIFKLGVNFANNWKDPHKLTIAAGTALTFRYRFSNSVEGTDVTVLDPSFYESGGVSIPVPVNRFSIQTVTLFQTGQTRIQPGQTTYATIAEAEAAIITRAYNVESNIAANGITRAYIILRHNATDLLNTTTSKIIEAQKFGGIASGGVALTDSAIIAALEYTPANDVDVVHKTTDETVNGIKSFADVVNMTKDAQSASPSLADFSFLANRIISTSRVSNAYGFYDANVFTKNYGNASYAAYSANTELGGVNSINHFNAFQSRGTWNNSGAIIDYRAFVDDNYISSGSGTITNKISFHSSGGTNAGTVTNWYGLKIDNPPSGGTVSNFYPIYVQGGDSFLGDSASLLQDYWSKNGGFFKSSLMAAGGEFETSLGTNGATGVGILTFGNRGANEIRLGRNLTGGFLDVYINNTVGALSASDGTKAFSITNSGVIKGNQFEPQSGSIIIGYTAPLTYLGAGGNVNIDSSGKLSSAIAPTTANDVVRLGDLSAYATLATPAFTGTPTAPTATVGTNTTQIATTAFVQGIRPYKVYTALLAQSGTSAPSATVLENTLGGTLVWAYSSVGGYTATLTGAFAINKTSVLISNGQAANALFGSYRLSDNAIGLTTTVAGTGAPVDGAIFNATIEIRVYN